LGAELKLMEYVKRVRPVQTNIIIFELKKGISTEIFINKLLQHKIKAVSIGPGLIRFVTHLDYTEKMQIKVIEVLKNLKF